MKKFSLLMCAIALLGLCFTSCDQQKGNKDLDDVVENGFYVIGEASAVADMSADNAKLGLMGAGINECTKEARAGLYEKYVALEGGKDFELVYVDGDQITHYGADSLALGDPYDVENGVTIQIYKGILAQNKKLRVEKSGFYHIALDLNVNGDLPNASILISPVDWQLSDGTALTASDFNKTSMSFTVKDVTKMKNSQYKYRWGNGWKIKVTPAAEVNIETNLGEGMKSGGADIKIAKSGVYDFTLTWTLTGGAIEKSFKETLNCTKEIEDKAITELITKQKKSGYRVITDGEFRRKSWHLDFMWGLNGIERVELGHGYFFQGIETYHCSVQIKEKISGENHPFVEHFKFVKQFEEEGIVAKQTIPAPAQLLTELFRKDNIESTLAVYPDYDELIHDIANAYKTVIKELYEAGCRNIQLDDCTWGMVVDANYIIKKYGKDDNLCEPDDIKQCLLKKATITPSGINNFMKNGEYNHPVFTGIASAEDASICISPLFISKE